MMGKILHKRKNVYATGNDKQKEKVIENKCEFLSVIQLQKFSNKNQIISLTMLKVILSSHSSSSALGVTKWEEISTFDGTFTATLLQHCQSKAQNFLSHITYLYAHHFIWNKWENMFQARSTFYNPKKNREKPSINPSLHNVENR